MQKTKILDTQKTIGIMESPKISIITVGMNHRKYLGHLPDSVYNNFTLPHIHINIGDCK